MDLRIVPLVSALYVLAFLDRSNIGNAGIAGMTKDLHLVGALDSLLHRLHHLRIPDANVEDRTTAHVAGLHRLGLGVDC